MTAVVHDIRHLTPRSNKTRSESNITHLARHHSGGSSGDWSTFWPYWNNTKGWGTGGYHEIILRDGSVQLCYDPYEITNGVGGHNSYVYHICVVGNGSFTDEQERTWEERSLLKLKQLGIPVDKVLGHREFKGTNTACPGIDMGMVRNRLRYLQGKGSNEIQAPTKGGTDVNYLTKGDTGAAVKILQQKLIKVGIKLTADSSFGPATEAAVKTFQKDNELIADGNYGPLTQQALDDKIFILSKYVPKPAPPVVKPAKVETIDPEKDRQPTRSLAAEWEEGKALGFHDGTYPHKDASRQEVNAMLVRAYKKILEEMKKEKH